MNKINGKINKVKSIGLGILAVYTIFSLPLRAATEIMITPSGLDHFLVQAPARVTAGSGLTLVVTACDSFGNVITDYALKGKGIEITTDGLSQILPDRILPAHFRSGRAEILLTYNTAETIAIICKEIGGEAAGRSKGVTVLPAGLDHFVLSVPAETTAGESFLLGINAQDAYGNTVSDSALSGKKIIIISSGEGEVSPTTVEPAQFRNGIARIGCSADKAEIIILTCQEKKGKAKGEVSLVIKPASLDHFLFSTVSTAPAGNKFQATITACDSFGNVITDYGAQGGGALLVVSGSGSLSPSSVSAAQFQDGVAKVELTYDKAESITISVKEVTPAVPSIAPSDKAREEIIEEGDVQEELFESEETSQSEAPIEEVAEIEDPYQVGRSCYKEADYLQAVGKFEEALEINSAHEKAKKYLVKSHYKMAKKYYKNGAYCQASKEFERLLTLAPTHLRAQKYLNICQAKIKMAEEVPAGEEVASPEMTVAQETSLIEEETQEEAEEVQEAVEEEIEEVQETIEEVEEEIQEGDVQEELFESEETSQSEAPIEEVTEEIEDPYQVGRSCYKEADYLKAIDKFGEALAINSAHEKAKKYLVKSHYKMAKKYYKNGAYCQASKEFDKVLALEPTHLRAQKYLNICQAKLKIVEEVPVGEEIVSSEIVTVKETPVEEFIEEKEIQEDLEEETEEVEETIEEVKEEAQEEIVPEPEEEIEEVQEELQEEIEAAAVAAAVAVVVKEVGEIGRVEIKSTPLPKGARIVHSTDVVSKVEAKVIDGKTRVVITLSGARRYVVTSEKTASPAVIVDIPHTISVISPETIPLDKGCLKMIEVTQYSAPAVSGTRIKVILDHWAEYRATHKNNEIYIDFTE
jgi:tetratricopeptide (TPR) repeat protein